MSSLRQRARLEDDQTMLEGARWGKLTPVPTHLAPSLAPAPKRILPDLSAPQKIRIPRGSRTCVIHVGAVTCVRIIITRFQVIHALGDLGEIGRGKLMRSSSAELHVRAGAEHTKFPSVSSKNRVAQLSHSAQGTESRTKQRVEGMLCAEHGAFLLFFMIHDGLEAF